jgi:hypothetical protein
MKVHYEDEAGVVASHAIKYNQTSTAADVTSYVVRKMQLQPAAYELVFRSLESTGSDDAVFKCKNDVLLSNAVASCNGSRGKWWVRQYQLSYSEFKVEREWLRKELNDAVEHQKEAFERGQAAEAQLREVIGRLDDVKSELWKSRLENESFLLRSKSKVDSIGKILDRNSRNGSHFQVISRDSFIFRHLICGAGIRFFVVETFGLAYCPCAHRCQNAIVSGAKVPPQHRFPLLGDAQPS